MTSRSQPMVGSWQRDTHLRCGRKGGHMYCASLVIETYHIASQFPRIAEGWQQPLTPTCRRYTACGRLIRQIAFTACTPSSKFKCPSDLRGANRSRTETGAPEGSAAGMCAQVQKVKPGVCVFCEQALAVTPDQGPDKAELRGCAHAAATLVQVWGGARFQRAMCAGTSWSLGQMFAGKLSRMRHHAHIFGQI